MAVICYISLAVLIAIPVEAATNPSKLPLYFEPNRGQAPLGTDYISRSAGMTAFVSAAGGSIRGTGAERLQWQFPGGRADARAAASDPVSGASNYLQGGNAARWIRNVPHFRAVRYLSLYPGIDLIYHAGSDLLEYDFELAPATDSRSIRIRFPDAVRVRIDGAGDLWIERGGQAIRLKKPSAYQDGAAGRNAVAVSYRQLGQREVGFDVSEYDRERTLIIDPVIDIAAYWGGLDAGAYGTAIATDSQQNIYVAGRALAPSSASGDGAGDYDAFVAKVSSRANELIYMTYVGGSLDDEARGIAVQADGAVFIAGQTFSPDFPVTPDAMQSAIGGASDAFLAEVSPDGSSLLAATYLGGSEFEYASALALDSSGGLYITGATASADFPVTAGALQMNSGGDVDAFVVKWSTVSHAILYATYIGGPGYDAGSALGIDGGGNVILTGSTLGDGFPVGGGGFQKVAGGGLDAFVARLDAAGATLLYATYLGGQGQDWGTAIAVDVVGNAYVTGWTASTDFPLVSAFQKQFNGGTFDAFVAKLTPAGTVVFSSYLGGSGDEGGNSIAVGADGRVYIAGETSSPIAGATVLGTLSESGNRHIYVTMLPTLDSPTPVQVLIGGALDESAVALAVDSTGRICLTGETDSVDLPGATLSAPAWGGGSSFLLRLSPPAAPAAGLGAPLRGGGSPISPRR